MDQEDKGKATSIKNYSHQFGIMIEKDLLEYPYIKERIKIFSYAFAKEHKMIVLEEIDKQLVVALANPLDFEALDSAMHSTQKEIMEVLSSQEQIDQAIEYCYHHKENDTKDYLEELHIDNSGSLETLDDYDLLEETDSSKVVKILNMILLGAIDQKASDIHFEPAEKNLIVRFRIDGVLVEKHRLGKELQAQIATRIKVIAQLDIALSRMPQDGRIKMRMGEKEIDFRISTIPVVFGERIVIRILDRSDLALKFEHLGMKREQEGRFLEELKHHQGIILVTGPTGSGKTTTLYSALNEISRSDGNIMTIEDPVEYKLEKMAQMSINPKIDLTFAKGLRHILRQDPDVIMIGEIRDKETAQIAVQAALTGHLVLSTLHTNDAVSTICRLVDMGIEPYLLSSSLNCIIAQRLIREICIHCKEAYTPLQEEIDQLNYANIEPLQLHRGKGCSKCFHTGYKGRIGIFELLNVGGKMKREIIKTVDAESLKDVAVEDGLETLKMAAAKLVIDGRTSLEEFMHISRGSSD